MVGLISAIISWSYLAGRYVESSSANQLEMNSKLVANKTEHVEIKAGQKEITTELRTAVKDLASQTTDLGTKVTTANAKLDLLITLSTGRNTSRNTLAKGN